VTLPDPSPSLEPPFRRGWPFLLLGFGLLGLGVSFWRPVPAGVWHDDGVYLVIGQALAAGDGLTYGGVPGAPPAVKFPPVYPGVLGLLWAVFGSLRPTTLAAVFLNLLLLAAAGTALARTLDLAGVGRRQALVVGCLALVSADVWRTALVPLSEPLFIALTAAAFVAWPAATGGDGRRGPAALAALLALVILTRSAGWAVVAGFGAALLMTRGVRAAVTLAGPAATLGLGWAWWASAHAPRITEGLRDVLGPYGGWLASQLFGSAGAFVTALPAHVVAVGQRIMALLLPGLSGWWLLTAAVPMVVAIAGGLLELRRRLPPLPWVVLAYLVVLILWPYVDRRLVAPLHPFLFLAAGVGTFEAARRVRSARARVTITVLALAWVGLLTTVTAGRAARGWAIAGYQLRAGRLAAAVEALDRVAPPGAVVGAPEFWAGIHLHGGWPTVPSARFTPRSEDEESPVWGTPREQLELWWHAGVSFVLLEQGGQIHGDALNLLEERCPGAVAIAARMPPQILVSLSWGDRCAEALDLATTGIGPA
jgi:hypothetical protein